MESATTPPAQSGRPESLSAHGGRSLRAALRGATARSASRSTASSRVASATQKVISTHAPSTGGRTTSLGRHQLPQDVRQDAAMLVVFHLDGSVDTAGHGDILGCAVFPGDAHSEILLGLEGAGQAGDIVGLGAVEVQGLRADAFFDLHW